MRRGWRSPAACSSAKRSRASKRSTDEHGLLLEQHVHARRRAPRSPFRDATTARTSCSRISSRTSSNGDHTFQRFNPAVGLTVGTEAVTFYAGYSEASRAPSPVELTCADEDDPCRLAERVRRRSAARAGRREDVRGRRARRAGATAAGTRACSARRTTTTSCSSAPAR